MSRVLLHLRSYFFFYEEDSFISDDDTSVWSNTFHTVIYTIDEEFVRLFYIGLDARGIREFFSVLIKGDLVLLWREWVEISYARKSSTTVRGLFVLVTLAIDCRDVFVLPKH